MDALEEQRSRPAGTPGEVFLAFLRLGLTSFGGPIAHIGYFRDEFVRRRGWLDEDTFAHIVALCQFLPGPASSQAGIIIGLLRAGVPGAALAWIAFTLPSAIVLVAFALGTVRIGSVASTPWMHGLLLAAVGVVAAAVASMVPRLCAGVQRKLLAIVAATIILVLPVSGAVQLLVIAIGAAYGYAFLRGERPARNVTVPLRGVRVAALAGGIAFVVLLAGLPLADRVVHGTPLNVVAAFYESGALVFGGGHVVLPLLQARVVPPGWIGSVDFMAGYGAAQAVPGPLFTFAAYLGAAMHGPVHGVGGAALALASIYLPSFLLIAAVLPVWNQVAHDRNVAAALSGVGATVVGLLLAALYRPVWTSAVHDAADVAVAVAAFAALYFGKVPAYAVVAGCALVAEVLRLT